MSTDVHGYNSFFHVLIFYEEINDAEISINDFNIFGQIFRNKHHSKKIKNNSNPKKNGDANNQNTYQSEQTEFNKQGQLFQKQKERQIFEKRKEQNQFMCADDLNDLRKKHDKVEQEKEEIMKMSIDKNKGKDLIMATQSLFKDEKQKMNDQMKKEEMEKIKQNIIEHGQNINANQSYYSLNNSIQIQNHRVSQIDHSKQIFANFNQSFMRMPNNFKNLVTPKQVSQQSISYVQRRPTNEPKLKPYFQKNNNSIRGDSYQTSKFQRQSSPEATPKLGRDEFLRMDESDNFTGVVNSQQNNEKRILQSKRSYDEYEIQQKSRQLDQTTSTINLNNQNHNKEQQDDNTSLQFDENYNNGAPEYMIEIQNNQQQNHYQDAQQQQSSEGDQQFMDLYNRKRYVPVAFCLQTETEYHDFFRQILVQIFEQIRVPINLNDKIYENRTLAFAELITNIAFLKTIPAPSFNSVYNLHLMNKVFTIQEKAFDQIPNRNQTSIKVLFDVLDIRTIFYCWKALLFDKTLVIVSSQNSLQFHVADALKQLLFPLTWQNSYIQPGNKALAGCCDGTVVCLYGSNMFENGFDYFDNLQHPDIVICDIDGGYTNNIQLPSLPSENLYIRILNMLKNSRINSYDKAFPEDHLIQEDSEDFITQTREAFFNFLKPFLSRVEDFIDKSIDAKTAFFDKYFKADLYFQYIGDQYGQKHQDFAKQLVTSSQFIHFCDDYFSSLDLTNFKMMKQILIERGDYKLQDLQQESQNHSSMSGGGPQLTGSRKRSTIMDGFSYDFQKCKSNKSSWPETEPVVFNIRMPEEEGGSQHQRVMLFEKILYMIEDSIRKKERDLSRKTNEHLIQNKQKLKYEKFIQTIKYLFPSKLKELHKQMQQHQMEQASNNGNQTRRQRKLTNQMSSIDLTVAHRQQQLNNRNHQLNQTPYNGTKTFKIARFDRKLTDSMYYVETDGNLINQQSSASFYDNKTQNKFNQTNIQNFNGGGLGTPISQIKNGIVGGGIGSPLVDQSSSDHNYVKQQIINNQNRQQETGGQQANNNGMNHQNDYETSTNNDVRCSFGNFNSFSQFSYVEQEQQRIMACTFKTTKFMYGKKGLINFLQHLFGLLTDKQKKRVNYYFAFKTQINDLIVIEKDQKRNEKEKREVKVIQEDVNEDEKSPSTKRDQQEKQGCKTPVSVVSQDQQKNTIPRSSNINLGNLMVQGPKFKNDSDWLSIDHWDQNACVLKTTYQYILFRMKLYESFEYPEDAYSRIWKLLLKFPSNYMKFFPASKFQQIWDNLTKSQQEQQFIKIGMQTDDSPQTQMIKQFYMKMKHQNSKTTFEKMNSTKTFSNRQSYKNDESLFYDVNLDITYIQKKIEKKQREQKLVSKLQCRNDSGTFVSHANTSQEVIKKYQAQKQKQIEKNQKFIANRIKSSLDAKLKKTVVSNKNLCQQRLSVEKDFPLSAKSGNAKNFTFSNNQTQIELSRTPKMERDLSQESNSFTEGKRIIVFNKYDYDMRNIVRKSPVQLNILKDPVKTSNNMIDDILKFWKRNSKFVEKKGSFKESELLKIQQKMKNFDSHLETLKNHSLEFKQNEDIKKQCFFLNLFNFLVLYQISLLMISNPEAVKNLKTFNMWQSFLISASIKIGYHKLSAHTIMHKILRYKLKLPSISQFILNQPDFEPEFSNYQVYEPHKLLNFGFYLPINKMPDLRKFNEQDFENDLKKSAQIYLRDRIKLRKDFFLIDMPKFIDWFGRDCYQNYYELINFIDSDIFEKQGSLKHIKEIHDKIKDRSVSINDFIIEFSSFSWEFKPLKMTEFFYESDQNDI